jgi:hypothetical protein
MRRMRRRGGTMATEYIMRAINPSF